MSLANRRFGGSFSKLNQPPTSVGGVSSPLGTSTNLLFALKARGFHHPRKGTLNKMGRRFLRGESSNASAKLQPKAANGTD